MAKNSAADSINMFEDLMIGLQDILKRLEMPGGFDDSGSEKNLVAKNIVPSDISTFNKLPAVKSVLNSNEKTRAYNIGVEWARAFFDIQKLNKSSEDTSKPSTILSKAKDTVGIGKEAGKTPESKSPGLGLILGIAGVLAAAYAIWEMFGAEGGFVMKAVSKLPNFLKLLKGTAGKIGAGLLRRIKFIPFIGALAGFVFAFMRFQEGDWIKGTLELVSAIASLSVVGLPLSYIIDGALLLHDLAEERGDETGMMAATVKGGKYGAKALVGILKKTVAKVGTKLLKILKFIPFIGGVAGLALSYMRFQEGEWIAGTFEFVSAILDFIPGVGNLASYIIDGGLLLYDLLKTPETGADKPKSGTSLGFSFSNGMNYIKKLIGPALTKALPYIPVIGNFAAIYDGIKMIMGNDVGGGVRKLIQGMFIFLPPGLSDQLISGYDWLMSMFTSETDQTTSVSQPIKPFGVKIKEYIQSKFSKLPTALQEALRLLGILDDNKPIEIPEQGKSVPSENANTLTTSSAISMGMKPLMLMNPVGMTYAVAKLMSPKESKPTQSSPSSSTAPEWGEGITAPIPSTSTAPEWGEGITAPITKTSIATELEEDTPSLLPGEEALNKSLHDMTSMFKNMPSLLPGEGTLSKPLNDITSMFEGIKANNSDAKLQTNAILTQNQLLQEVVNIARQQLDVTKKKSGVIVNNMQSAPANNTNISGSSFNTGTQSSRQLYSNSPYTLSNA